MVARNFVVDDAISVRVIPLGEAGSGPGIPGVLLDSIEVTFEYVVP